MLGKMEKATVSFVVIVILGSLFVGGYVVYANRQKQQEAEQVFHTNQRMLGEKGKIQIALSELMDDKGYLQKGITQKEISELRDELESNYHAVAAVKRELEEKKAWTAYKNTYEADKQRLEMIQQKASLQESVNNMFEKKDKKVAIGGSEVNKELPIIKNVEDKKIENDQKELKTLANDDWKQAISSLIEIVKTQKNQMKEATELVEKLFEKEKPKADVSNENYDQAKAAVDKIKNDAVKKALTDRLAKVKQVLDEREKQAAETKPVEQKSDTSESSTTPNASTTTQQTSEPNVSVQNQQAQVQPATQENINTGENGNSYVPAGENVSTTPQVSQNTGEQTTGGGGTTQTQSNNIGVTPATTPSPSRPATPTPAPTPVPSKPYPLNPYHGNGILEPSEAAASDAGYASGKSFNIVSEFWSDGTEKVYLELY